MAALMSAATARASAGLALAVVVYASLYPFEGWRDQAPTWGEWWRSPWPKYWTAWDLWVNWLGYVPLGAAFASWLGRQQPSWPRAVLAVLLASAVSFALESLQSGMVHRVASNLDWALNTLGALCGVGVMGVALRSSWPQAFSVWRRAHLFKGAGLMLLVLALWLLLQPLPMLLPFAVGRLPPQWWDQAAATVARWWPQFTPWVWANWTWPQQAASLVALLAVPAGVLRFTWRDVWSRVAGVWLFLALAVLLPTLAHAWSYGWSHAGDWLMPPVIESVLMAAALASLLMVLPALLVAWCLFLALVAQYLGVNALAETGYWTLHWQSFTQGQFVRWYGLLAWVAVLWPVLTLILLVRSRWMTRAQVKA